MSRTYRDPIHGDIILDSNIPEEALLIDLIDCPEMQRLRQVKQLGVCWMVYHGAEHSRFGHSLGCMYVARKMFDSLDAKYKGQAWWDNGAGKLRAAVLAAALVHDVGHMPYSHSAEKIVDIHHEDITYAIIEDDASFIRQDMLAFDKSLPNTVVELLNGTHEYQFLCGIVSGQLDADRMDYLLRDSHYTGVTYGHFDLKAIISAMTIDVATGQMVIEGAKGIAAVERYLHAGYQIYKQVMYHKTVLAADILLQSIFRRVKDLLADIGDDGGQIDDTFLHMNAVMLYWLRAKSDDIDLGYFIHLNDSCVRYHIEQWQFSDDSILSDLACRFINRDLFICTKVGIDEKETEVAFFSEDDGQDALSFEPQLELESSYYYKRITLPTKPGRFYNPDITGEGVIYVDDGSGVREIAEASDIVSSLKQTGQYEEYIVST